VPDATAPGVREPSTGLELSPAMAARYGVRRTNRFVVGVLAVLCVAFVGGVLALGYKLATPDVQAKALIYRVVSPQQIDLTFEVRRDSLTPTVCVLRARAEDHTDVGYVELTISPGREYVQPTVAIATYAEATVAEVLGCAAGERPRVEPPAFLPGTANPPQITAVDGS
jgi:hypothetical protein